MVTEKERNAWAAYQVALQKARDLSGEAKRCRMAAKRGNEKAALVLDTIQKESADAFNAGEDALVVWQNSNQA